MVRAHFYIGGRMQPTADSKIDKPDRSFALTTLLLMAPTRTELNRGLHTSHIIQENSRGAYLC